MLLYIILKMSRVYFPYRFLEIVRNDTAVRVVNFNSGPAYLRSEVNN